jgi:hypothetical protein
MQTNRKAAEKVRQYRRIRGTDLEKGHGTKLA